VAASPGLEEGVFSTLLLHMFDESIIKLGLECQSRHYVPKDSCGKDEKQLGRSHRML
jgi:hypothetical protein